MCCSSFPLSNNIYFLRENIVGVVFQIARVIAKLEVALKMTL